MCKRDNYLKRESICNITTSVAPTIYDKLIYDTGATNTYFKEAQKFHHHNLEKLMFGPKAALPDNTKISATHQGILKLHPKLQIKTLMFPELKNESLLFIGQLCDLDCTAVFHQQKNANIQR